MAGKRIIGRRYLTREGPGADGGACEGAVRRADGESPCVLSGPHPWHQDQRALGALEEVRGEVSRVRAELGRGPESRAAIHLVWSGGREPLWRRRELEEAAAAL